MFTVLLINQGLVNFILLALLIRKQIMELNIYLIFTELMLK